MKITDSFILSAMLAAIGLPATAAEIEMNTARMQAMDKITGHVSVINVPVNGGVTFGSLSIVVRSCKTRPVEETPENFAFVDVSDKNQKGEEFNIFKGWMLSSSPATNAVEHPIYDVWLLQCLNTKIASSQLLTAEQLAARDNLPQSPKNETAENITPTAELKSADTAPKSAGGKKQNPMAELEYLPDESEDGQPENIIDSSSAENATFSFDEEDDSTEIQEEINRLKKQIIGNDS